MASAPSLTLAVAVLALAGGLAAVRFEPVAVHTLATCAVLLLGGVLVARDRRPGWLPDPGRRYTPAALSIGLLLVSAVALFGLLRVGASARIPAVQSVLVVLAVPAAEEIFFRGALLRLSPDHRAVSVVLSACAFGLMHHALGWPQVWVMTAAGALLGTLAVVTRSVALPIVVHCAFNALAVAYREQVPVALLLPLVAGFGLSFGSWWRSRD
jgi:membrane protease YdiL (CAAX protease family)